jgi:hypothetical protein
MAAPASVLSFHYKQGDSEEWAYVPGFLRRDDYPDYLSCMRRNAQRLEAKWGADMTRQVLDTFSRCLLISLSSRSSRSEGADSPLPTGESIVIEAKCRHIINDILELVAYETVPNARFRGDGLFLHLYLNDSDLPPKWQVAKWIESLQSCLGMGEHASLGVWPVMPVFAKIVMGRADAGQLPEVWDRLSDEEKEDVAAALRNESALAQFSCTLIGENLSALNAIANPDKATERRVLAE